MNQGLLWSPTVDGRNPAPPFRNPEIPIPLLNTNKHLFLHGFKVVQFFCKYLFRFQPSFQRAPQKIHVASFCPFETWLPAKSRKPTIYKLQCSGVVMHPDPWLELRIEASQARCRRRRRWRRSCAPRCGRWARRKRRREADGRRGDPLWGTPRFGRRMWTPDEPTSAAPQSKPIRVNEG